MVTQQRFYARPVVVDAFQWLDRHTTIPKWAAELGIFIWNPDGNTYRLVVPTPDGRMTADPGDWVVCGIDGVVHVYPLDIFTASYAPME